MIYFFIRFYLPKGYWLLRKVKIKNNVDTIKYIVKNKVSVSRFGDGELALMTGHDTGFQIYSDEIGEKLKLILKSRLNNHITCLPYPWKDLRRLNYSAFEYWSSWLLHHLEKYVTFFDLRKQYYDTNFTRFYIDYRNNNNAQVIVPYIKDIWDGRDICLIEGEFSKLGVGNDLFDNARSVRRIICPSTNAYGKYAQILNAIRQITPQQNSVILIALGMTATCLAYDFAKEGYWAIDIGHVDIEYEWYRMNAKGRVPIPGKYVAETKEKIVGGDISDELYESQIIERIL